MQPAVIRAMAVADLERVVAIAAGERNAPKWPRSAYASALESGEKPQRLALVADDAATGRIAGFAVARVIGPEAELETIVTATEFRGRGLARQMLNVLAAKLSRAGVSQVFLEVRESNRPARALYESQGFVETGRRTAYFADPVEDAVLMRAMPRVAAQ